jgi:hypothetical protein
MPNEYRLPDSCWVGKRCALKHLVVTSPSINNRTYPLWVEPCHKLMYHFTRDVIEAAAGQWATEYIRAERVETKLREAGLSSYSHVIEEGVNINGHYVCYVFIPWHTWRVMKAALFPDSNLGITHG